MKTTLKKSAAVKRKKAPVKKSAKSHDFIQQLFDIISSRKNASPETSYVASLLHKGPIHIVRKLGEETIETLIAAQKGKKEELIAESADLLFHLLVLWAAKDITPAMISAELKRREAMSGIEEKNSRKK